MFSIAGVKRDVAMNREEDARTFKHKLYMRDTLYTKHNDSQVPPRQCPLCYFDL